jgi:uncharacterized protein YcfJ
MTKQAAIALICATAAWANAQEVGQVITRTAVYQQVAVPRQTCTTPPPTAPAQTSGGGAIIGAIAGGLIGSQLGGRDSQGITTMAGVIGGAVLGNKVEGQSAPTPTTTCTTQTVYENRLIGYNVVYEYAGKQYNVQLPQDPGPTIPLQVTPMVAPRSQAPEIPSGITETRVVYVPTPVYRSHTPVYSHVNMGWGWPPVNRHGYWR